LGGGEVTMIDMAEAFATLANQGVHIPATAILEVKDYNGQVLTSYDANATNQALNDQFFNEADSDHNRLGKTFHHLKRVLEREPAYLVGHILSDNQARSSAFGVNSKLRIGNKTVSVKTGTTNDLRDNWTIGYTPQYVVATWVGNNDNSVMSRVVSGVTGAAPIWNDLMTKLVSEINDEDLVPARPEGVVEKPVCRLTGSAPTDGCELRSELFWDEALPQPGLAVRKNIWVDKTTGQPAFFGSSVGTSGPEEGAPMDNLELQEHLVVSDPFTQEFCLDCQPPAAEPTSEPARPSFPSTTIDLNTFDPTNKLKLYNSRRQPTKRSE
jgi:membrane carboxypeptidase/penicillin-binding protein